MNRQDFEDRFVALRRALIERDFAGLNPRQREGVLATEGPLLLLAGAGSGKTTVLIHRTLNLIRYGRGSDTREVPAFFDERELRLLEEAAAGDAPPRADLRPLLAVEPAEPWRILAITFTNKAANELKSRLADKLGPEQAGAIWAQTFHSACVRILRRYGESLGYSSSFTIYDASDAQAVMKRVLKDLDLDEKTCPPRTVLSAVSRAKDRYLDPAAYAAEAQKSYDPRQKAYAQAYAAYQERLKNADAMDFDDLIYQTVRLLEENEEARGYYQRYFKYVLVDEYQDTSLLQYRLVSLLAGGRGNLCVVGDDDQSIYRFRGATIENILSFEHQFPGARLVKLEQNYRSTAHILEAANAVIRHNRGRKGKELWTQAGDGEKPLLMLRDTDDEEAAYVAGQILEGVDKGMSFRDFAVLYRMNAQSNRLEYAFKRQGIPYKVVGGMRFFDRAEIKDITSYLCTVQNPADDLRLLRIINTPARGIGAATVERVQEIAHVEGVPVYTVLSRADRYPRLGTARKKLLDFVSLIESLRAKAESLPLDALYNAILEDSGYTAALGDSDEALGRLDNLNELRSNIASYMEESDSPTLAGFLDEIALYTDLDSVQNDGSAVVMMTMHAAKGLEFPWVFVVGMEDGIFPSQRSIGEPEALEEERRLCYVAMTRARRRLVLTAARRRMLYGKTTSNRLSRFLDEIPQEHLSQSGLERQAPRPEGYTYNWAGYQPPVRRPEPPKPAPAPAPALRLQAGDRVQHKAFGEGAVTKVTPMPGGDALLEIDFDGKGVKRLMLKTASAFMRKIS